MGLHTPHNVLGSDPVDDAQKVVARQVFGPKVSPSSGGASLPLTTKGDLPVEGASGVVRLPVGADGQVLTADSTQPDGLSWQAAPGAGAAGALVRSATFVNSAGAVALPVNDVYLMFAAAATLRRVTILTSGGPGSCTVDIRKKALTSGFPPASADSICGGSPPSISAGSTYDNSTLTGFTTTVNAGDVIAISLTATSNFKQIVVQLSF